MSVYEFQAESVFLPKNYLINDGNGIYPMSNKLLDVIHREFDGMFSHYSKLLVVRLDFHLGIEEGNNNSMSVMIKKLRKKLGSKYSMGKFGYVWVREKEKSKSHHYHLMLILNGHKIRHPSFLISWIEKRWLSLGYPKPYTPKHCFYFILRYEQQKMAECLYRVSYLAKKRGKGYTDKYTRNYSSSRIKNLINNQRKIK